MKTSGKNESTLFYTKFMHFHFSNLQRDKERFPLFVSFDFSSKRHKNWRKSVYWTNLSLGVHYLVATLYETNKGYGCFYTESVLMHMFIVFYIIQLDTLHCLKVCSVEQSWFPKGQPILVLSWVSTCPNFPQRMIFRTDSAINYLHFYM